MNNRVLIISCNCLSQTSGNGKTVMNFFRNYPSDCVAQFYTYNEVPDFKNDYSLYRITDREMIDFKIKGKPCGKIIREFNENPAPSSAAKMSFESLKRLIRDILWRGSKWYKYGLLDWVDEYKPDFIFFLGLNNPYLYKLCIFLQKKYDIPVLIYNTDDYLFGRRKISPCFWLRLCNLRRCFKTLMSNEKTNLLTINEVMQREYKRKFSYDSHILTNYILSDYKEYKLSDKKDKTVVYIGNVLHNRWKSLIRFADLLQANNPGFKIEVYGGNISDNNILEEFRKRGNITVGKYLNKKEVFETIERADYVLHIESFDYDDICLARLSLSTKITEYAAMCKPIICFSPRQVASSKVLFEHNLAVFADQPDAFSKLNNGKCLKELVKNAYDYFNNQRIDNNMENLIDELVSGLK